VVLEVARMSKGLNPEKTLRFCIFSNEERGQAGSKAYVSSLRDVDRVKAVINLDVLGYKRLRNPFQMKAIGAHGSLRGKARAIYRMGRNFLHGFYYPKQALVVAGRPANGNLVSKVEGTFKETTDLRIKTLVGEECG
jgi:Zn-dependent M28 family amino/carboxypeptidase